MQSTTMSHGNGIGMAFKWISAVLAVMVPVMAFLAGQGFFNAKPEWINRHGDIGNVLFLVAIVQLVLAFMLYQKKLVSMNLLGLNVLIVIAVAGQIGLGYSGTENNSGTAVAWHLPLGVAIMGLTTINAVIAWLRADEASRQPTDAITG